MMNKKTVIIQGSSRSNGNTNRMTSFLQNNFGFEVVDLNTKNIHPYHYDYRYKNDDFIPTIKEIVTKYDTIIFATPIYWYTMSGIMKNFFDRITDCLKTEKSIGKQLKGKNMAVLSCGSDAELKKGFTMPFEESAKYLGMEYLGNIHTWIADEEIPPQVKGGLEKFARELKI
ncbi:NADPH-dependent FMN reductase [Zhouia amylolytica]|uniref:NADPH-dependent FMN reductase n=1 Tax=Zhouia amylolytica TaxID=376730 RepID=A0A1I6U2D5_9FLAO|nr:flavodoxin family protein [Zhouia amylolytica]SFS95630.1 NADPH-dependent FMN reductase [Zhouia amylolytica]